MSSSTIGGGYINTMLPTSVLPASSTKQLLDVVLESTNNVIWVEAASKEAVEVSGEVGGNAIVV